MLLCFNSFAQRDNSKVQKKGVNIGAQNQKSSYGGLLNIKSLSAMTLLEAGQSSGEIDIVYTYGNTTGINLLTPSSPSMSSFGSTYKNASEQWSEKNRGTLVYLENNRASREIYRSVKVNADLESAFEKAIQKVSEVSDYKRSKHGPNTRISALSVGDYFVFKSNSGRGYAIGRIVDLQPGYQGFIRVDLLTTSYED